MSRASSSCGSRRCKPIKPKGWACTSSTQRVKAPPHDTQSRLALVPDTFPIFRSPPGKTGTADEASPPDKSFGLGGNPGLPIQPFGGAQKNKEDRTGSWCLNFLYSACNNPKVVLSMRKSLIRAVNMRNAVEHTNFSNKDTSFPLYRAQAGRYAPFDDDSSVASRLAPSNPTPPPEHPRTPPTPSLTS